MTLGPMHVFTCLAFSLSTTSKLSPPSWLHIHKYMPYNHLYQSVLVCVSKVNACERDIVEKTFPILLTCFVLFPQSCAQEISHRNLMGGKTKNKKKTNNPTWVFSLTTFLFFHKYLLNVYFTFSLQSLLIKLN